MVSFRERFARMLSPKIEAVGLEVGTSALKVVELRAGNPPTLSALAVRPMPAGLVSEDEVTDQQGLAEEIKALFQEAGIQKRFTVTAVSNRQAITRNIHVPRMSVAELDEAIRWEAERYIPFPIDEVVLDYFVLDNPEDVAEGEQLEVVIAAARLDEVSQQVDYLKHAGLEPHVIDVKPFSLLRALRGSLHGEHLTKATLSGQNFTEGNEIGVVLEIAASTSTVTLVRGQRVLMNRNINVSSDDFTTAIQRAFGLDFDSAEEVKLEYGTATIPTEDEEDLLNFDAKREQFSPSRVYDALRPVLVELTTEIRRSLEFFRVQSGDATISRMLVTGGGAKLRGLPDAIGDALGIKVELGDPWLAVTFDEGRFDSQYLKKIAPEFAVPLGLALRGVAGVD
ncbi:MAG: type IV pilus assembly protein PilM [Trueperaceae bacterium]|nr:type IV pilus assembly protein PilM [Trueperaceae bacterium]MCC6310498.1 type IV pilus assembly protein PilM [Trueperaceae bacterium]MCW5819611.1 type IV pilus assembly protein PilM [Trueperaceae bacterium]